MTETLENKKKYSLRTLLLLAAIACAAVVFFGLPYVPWPPSPLITPEAGGSLAGLKPAWNQSFEEVIATTPVIVGDKVIVHTTAAVYALKLGDGHLLWRADSPANTWQTRPPDVDGDIVVVPETDGYLAAFSLTTGARLWRSCAFCSSGWKVQDMALSGGYAYVSMNLGNAGGIAAYRVGTGYQMWDAPDSVDSFTPIAADGEYVYVLGTEGIEALDPQTGKANHMISASSFEDMSQFAIADGVLFLIRWGGDASKVQAVTLADGKVKWTTDFKTSGMPMRLALNGDTLYVSADRVYALSLANGETAWNTAPISSPGRAVELRDRVYVRDGEGRLHVLDAITGRQVGQLALGNTTNNDAPPSELNPASNRDFLLIPIGNRQIFAYRPD